LVQRFKSWTVDALETRRKLSDDLYKHFQLRRLLRTELRSLSFVNPNSSVDLDIGFTRNAPASNPWRTGNRYWIYLLFFLYNFSPVILHVNSSFRIITSLRCLLSERCKDEIMINLRLQTMKSFSCRKQVESRKSMNRQALVDLSNFMIITSMPSMSLIHGICRPDTK
jgi:hypothetical protein